MGEKWTKPLESESDISVFVVVVVVVAGPIVGFENTSIGPLFLFFNFLGWPTLF